MRIVAPLCMFLFISAACVVAVATLSCGSTDCKDPKNAGSATCAVEKILIDCTAPDIQELVTKYEPGVEEAIRNHDDATLERDAFAFGGCVISEAFSHFILGTKGVAGSGSTVYSGSDARARYDALRAKMWPRASFQTKAGTL